MKKPPSDSFEIFPWSENFDTGIDIIDEQHKKLVHILNQLAYHLANSAEANVLNDIFNELASYTQYHFETEEKIWLNYFKDDPIYTDHISTHGSFINKILDLKNQQSSKTLDDVIQSIVSFLTHWLAYHILDTDKRMAKIVFALDQGQTLEQAKNYSNTEMSGSMETLINTILSMYDKISTRSLELMREKSLRKKAEKELSISEERWKFILESNSESIWDWDVNNAEYKEGQLPLFDSISSSIKNSKSHVHPADIEGVKADFLAHIEGETEFYINKHRILHNDGGWGWVISRGKVVSRDEHSTPTRMVGTHSDITERELSSLIYNHSGQAMFVSDANNKIIGINAAFTTITGYSRKDIIGEKPGLLSSDKQNSSFYKNMWNDINNSGSWSGEIWNKRKNGEIYAGILNINTVVDGKGNVDHYLALLSDITEKKIADEKILQYSYYDVLTALPNRALLADRFNLAIARCDRTGHQMAICFLDLDDFKPINDNHGHEVGDQLLIEVAKRIRSTIRTEDTVSRVGGDEFALLLNDIESIGQAEYLLTRILKVLSQPYLINEKSHKVTASIGMTLYPDDDNDIDLLLRHADQAMYLAKLEGKNKQRLFSASDNQKIINAQIQLKEIKQAVLNEEFCLYYQPKVNMVTGKVFGVEALLRWQHPKKGIIPPLDFLPLIDNTDLEFSIGRWVVNQALDHLNSWQHQGVKLQVSINISSFYLQSNVFLKDLENALNKHPDIASQDLQLEILESSTLSNINALDSIIKKCQKNLGVNIALDDFGTGYSSLSHIKDLSTNVIKIDRSFIQNMLDDPNDYAIINGILGLANAFNRNIIAEGVETTAHGLMLLLMGCYEAQGYGIAKPMPDTELTNWLNNFTPNKEWMFLGSKQLSIKEKKVMLFQLITERWKNTFITNIQLSPNDVKNWPIMNSIYCPCGTWIEREKQGNIFNSESFKQLDNAHTELHLIADSLYLKYQEGKLSQAREGLEELQSAFNKMNDALKNCE